MEQTIETENEPKAQPTHLISLMGLVAASAWFGWISTRTRSKGRRRFSRSLATAAGTAAVVQLGREIIRRTRPAAESTASTAPGAEAPAGSVEPPPPAPTAQTPEQRLSEAVEETFPASDPVSVHIE